MFQLVTGMLNSLVTYRFTDKFKNEKTCSKFVVHAYIEKVATPVNIYKQDCLWRDRF